MAVRTRWHWLSLLLLPLAQQSAFGQNEDFVTSPNNLTTFLYGTETKRVWASLKNDTRPAHEWQFRYDPIFAPEVDEKGNLVYQIFQDPTSYRLQFQIILDNGKARALAADAVRKVKPDAAAQIEAANMYALNAGTITLTISDAAFKDLGAKLEHNQYAFLGPTPSFVIRIDVPTKEVADKLLDILPHTVIDYSVSYAAKSAKENSAKIKYTDLRKSTLFNKLNGLNSTETYVHRDDLRNMADTLHQEIEFEGVVEDPASFDQGIFNRILSTMTNSANTATAQWNETKWASTYNADDLKPDVITKTLDKVLDYDQGSHQWKRSGSVDTGGKVGVLDLFSAEGKFGGSFSTEELQTWLKQHNVETSFEGNKIVVKSLDLQRVNMSAFSQEGQLISTMTIVATTPVEQQGSIDLYAKLGNQAVALPIAGQVAELQKLVERNGASNTSLEKKLQTLFSGKTFTRNGPQVDCLAGWDDGGTYPYNAQKSSLAECPAGSVLLSGGCDFTCLSGRHASSIPTMPNGETSPKAWLCRLGPPTPNSPTGEQTTKADKDAGRKYSAWAVCLTTP